MYQIIGAPAAELDLERDVCDVGYPLRPHVVWFGEAVPAYEQAIEWVQDVDIFIVIGSSLAVYPVAGLVHEIPASCQAFYIDPKANQQHLPAQYECIVATATQGLAQLKPRLLPITIKISTSCTHSIACS